MRPHATYIVLSLMTVAAVDGCQSISVDGELEPLVESAGDADTTEELATDLRALGSRNRIRQATAEELAQVLIPGDPPAPVRLPLPEPRVTASTRDEFWSEIDRGAAQLVLARIATVERPHSGAQLTATIERPLTLATQTARAVIGPCAGQPPNEGDTVLMAIGPELTADGAYSAVTLVHGTVGPAIPVHDDTAAFPWGDEHLDTLLPQETM